MKPGYLLKVTTWENDADNYSTWEKDGLSDNDVRFYILIAKLFQSDGRGNGYGNSEVARYGTPSPQLEAVDATIKGFIANGGVVPADWYGSDSLYEIIGIWCEGERYRVYDGHRVLFVPDEIKDVTDEFANV